MEMVVETRRSEEYVKGVRHLCETGVTRLPEKYVLPLPERPYIKAKSNIARLKLPVIDFAQLLSPPDRPRVLQSLAKACQDFGFFQVANHSIPSQAIERMMDVGKRFFELPFEERSKYMSTDIRSPVRYGTSFNQLKDGVFCWRDFLKLSCSAPLQNVLHHWPSSPSDLREEALRYVKQNKSLFLVLMEAILETLSLDAGIIRQFEDGSQMMVMNCYPPCPEPDLTLGMPPHSDYGFLTLLLSDNIEGLQVQCRGEWVSVEPVPGSLVVNVGDHLEIFSNGRYKSVLHRVVVNSWRSRISVASLHSLPFEAVVRPAEGLIDKDNPRRYKDTDFAAFLQYLSSCETKHKNFLDSRKFIQAT